MRSSRAVKRQVVAAGGGEKEALARIERVRKSRDNRLDLSGLGLRVVPPEIGYLDHLWFLRLDHNFLEHLPDEVERLTKLGSLILRGNRVQALPSLNRMRVLQAIDLSDNGMTQVPPAIWDAGSVRELDISDNKLATLPPEIGRLTQMIILDAHGNQIRTLPRALARLHRLSELRLNDNPLRDPLPALLKSGIGDLFAYLRSLDKAAAQYEAKLLLVGEGEVGKSSLITALEGGPFEKHRDSTHGIEIRPLRFDHPALDVEMMLNAWDFGGQEIYRITHQFFFTRRALYLVVWKPRQGQDENAIEEWCRRIGLRVGDEAKILIVSTHATQRASELDYPLLRAKFGAMVVGNHAVDNENGSGVDELRDDIARHASELPPMGQMVSAAWQAARTELLELQEAQISYRRCSEICAGHGLGSDATRALVRMLHHLGLVIYYDEDRGLRDIVVLQPEWLTKAISYVLDDRPTRAACGILDHRRLPEIWDNEALAGYEPRDHPYFLRLMEKFDVSYRIPETQQSLVGQLVPYERPDVPWRTSEGMRTLTLRCRLSEPVDGLIGWLTVRHHRFSVGVHWRRGVFLVHDAWGSQALLEMDDPQQLALTVSGPSPGGFFSVLLDGIEHLVKERWEGLSYELLVPCKGALSDGSPCPESFKYRLLVRDREEGDVEARCAECRERFDIGELVTGFAPVNSSLHAELQAISDRIDVLGTDVQARTSQIAEHVRLVLRAVNEEVSTCPRLFTLVPATAHGVNALKFWDTRSRLTLWCEHADHEHPRSDASYELHQGKEWANSLAPYAGVVVKTLQLVVPVATAGLGVGMSEQEMKSITDELTLMKTVVEKLPAPAADGPAHDDDQGGLTRAEGAGLRALRALLAEKDPASVFGGLRRRQTPGGDFVWICPEHIHEYDPGLPVLP
jgi:hypothetical protein